MFTLLLSLLTICSCVVGPPGFDEDLGRLSDVFADDGKFISIIFYLSVSQLACKHFYAGLGLNLNIFNIDFYVTEFSTLALR